ncbi:MULTISPECIES: methyltransferase domain-containing protein [Bacteria]|nr:MULTISPECIES: methyltransferase domain-containing protein [Bacteria]UVP93939.1 methyltransferase domain-containing protein [Bacteroides fragilis]UVS35933.1 methyltransferase domain-containing protein [Bacteroides faecis]
MANIVNFTDKQFENRLNDNLEELVQGKKAVESPTAFLLGGQPGSGKTSLRSAILEETQGNVIVIDKEGLKAAGEWHQLKPLFPSLEGKSVLDLGCGYGWHCKFAEEQGATKILGIDLSKKMIEEAQKRNSGNQIEYRISGLEEYDYPENEWDCVISNLALHYIEDIVEIFQKVYRTLKPGGIFLFNIEHPVFTAGVGQDWIYTDDGKPQYWAIDNYFITGERNTHF